MEKKNKNINNIYLFLLELSHLGVLLIVFRDIFIYNMCLYFKIS